MAFADTHKNFFKGTVQRLELGHLTLAETAYPAGLKMSKHSHEPAYLSFVLRGAYSEQTGRQTRTCRPSTLIIHPPGEQHAVEFHQTGAKIFRVEIKQSWLAYIREHSKILDRPAHLEKGAASRFAARLYCEFKQADELTPLSVEGITLEVLSEMSRRAKDSAVRNPPRWLARARDFLHANFDQALGLQQLALMCGVHPVYLAREFRRHYRCTVGAYLRQLRVEAACRDLCASDVPLAEIATGTGFCDQSHFNRTFKRATGMTPTEYRAVFRSS
ncbi:MAG TPA: AraC family transcriptional regulator [Pyrinomonadaceae bacterium]|nr:AraC family transcriptional regulator [Pyrinomonadaceae bacterium]